MALPKSVLEVLCYSEKPASRSTVRRCYRRYCIENGILEKCAVKGCQFNTGDLFWNGGQLPLILDHEDGCKQNNSPSNLRWLCPNCDAQQARTRGGANRRRVQNRGPHGYAIQEKGSQDRAVKAFEGGTGSEGKPHVED
jgi:hypothetical protein